MESNLIVERLIKGLKRLPLKDVPLAGGKWEPIVEEDPLDFLAHLRSAIRANKSVLVLSPETENAIVESLLKKAEELPHRDELYIVFATSGSSGPRKYCIHDLSTLWNAVEGYRKFFAQPDSISLLVLPLYHIGGFMALFRALILETPVQFASYRDLGRHEFKGGETLSLVPTQLERLLKIDRAVRNLRPMRRIFIGGGPAREVLLSRARELNIPLSPAYGSTETAAMVTALSPMEFLRGVKGVGKSLPHVEIEIDSANSQVRVITKSLCLGYLDILSDSRDTSLLMPDFGRLGDDGYLEILGRADRMIISGGKKINPKEIEEIIIEGGDVAAVYVFGLPDKDWGEMVCAAIEIREDKLGKLSKSLVEKLDSLQRPKRLYPFEEIPRNAVEKFDREAVLREIEQKQFTRVGD